MKVECKIYKGIEYVQYNELPQAQQEKLLQTLQHDFFIKIMIDGKIVGQCLQYKDYSRWYDKIFSPSKLPKVVENIVSEVAAIKPDLAINKY
jgi:hypothetical protein